MAASLLEKVKVVRVKGQSQSDMRVACITTELVKILMPRYCYALDLNKAEILLTTFRSLPISSQVTDYIFHIISETVVRDYRPLDSMSERNNASPSD